METKRIRSKGDSGRCSKQRTKQAYGKKRRHHSKKKKQTDDIAVQDDTDFSVGSSSTTTEELPEVVVQEEIISAEIEPTTEELTEVVEKETISASKVIDIDIEIDESTTEILTGYRLMDISILADVFLCMACPECLSTNSLILNDINEKKKGLARYFQIQCTGCPYIKDFCSSKEIINRNTENNKGGGKFMVSIPKGQTGTHQCL